MLVEGLRGLDFEISRVDAGCGWRTSVVLCVKSIATLGQERWNRVNFRWIARSKGAYGRPADGYANHKMRQPPKKRRRRLFPID
jgi:hypothetical protein